MTCCDIRLTPPDAVLLLPVLAPSLALSDERAELHQLRREVVELRMDGVLGEERLWVKGQHV
jgi:hypothetical protein